MCTLEEAVANKRLRFFEIQDGKLKLKKYDTYMYQVQGQLNVTKRDICYFIVWTPKGVSVEVIHENTFFWEKEMLPKLQQFYLSAMLPEIIDSRHARKMPIREVYLK